MLNNKIKSAYIISAKALARFSRMIFIAAILITNISSSIIAQVTEEVNLFSPVNRLKFGNHLFCNKDYLRAIDEYREYLKFSNNDTARFKFALSLAAIGRATEALDNYKGLFFSSIFSEQARMEFYKVNFLMEDYQKFRSLCTMQSYLPEKHKSEIVRLNFFTYLIDDIYLPDSAEFINSFDAEDKSEVADFYLRKKYPPYKSTVKAAILSAIIPGAGKIYTEDYAEGITAFIATGVLSFIAYNNFTNNHKLRGTLFAGLAVLSYAGNIYGSAASAQIYNAGIRFNFESEVKLYLNKKNYFIPVHNFLCN